MPIAALNLKLQFDPLTVVKTEPVGTSDFRVMVKRFFLSSRDLRELLSDVTTNIGPALGDGVMLPEAVGDAIEPGLDDGFGATGLVFGLGVAEAEAEGDIEAEALGEARGA